MTRLTKKQQKIRETIKPGHAYNITEAIDFLKSFASTRFRETVDIVVELGVDAKKSDQQVRSWTNLPAGTGKVVRVAVFAQGAQAEKARQAGADKVGFEDLAQEIKEGKMDFDVLIATPDAMRLIGPIGPILGPRGLMPNPKTGTVTANVEGAVKDSKSGQVRYRTDKNGLIHCPVGKVDFESNDIIKNVTTLMGDLRKAKPTTSKGVYIRKVTLSTTMGPGISIDISSIPV